MHCIKSMIAYCFIVNFLFAGGRNNKDMVASESLKTLQETDTTRLEKYEPKIIINAKWGSGPGEFGVIKEAGGIAPNCFALDKDKNILIVDPVNNRIQKFDPTGRYCGTFNYIEKNIDGIWWEPYDITTDE